MLPPSLFHSGEIFCWFLCVFEWVQFDAARLKVHLYFPVRFSARCWGPYNTYSSQREMVYASQKEQEAEVLGMCVSHTVLCATAAYSWFSNTMIPASGELD